MKESLPWGLEGPVGTWTVEGMLPSGDSYQGELCIQRFREDSDAFTATWKTSIGVFTGLGLLYNGQFLVSRVPGELPATQAPGIVWYSMSGSGDLDAVWSLGKLEGRIGTGSTRGGIPGCLTGVRKILYFDDDGNAIPPELDLEIRAEGAAFGLAWRNGALVSFDGVGLATTRGLCSAWSASEPKAPKTLLVCAAESPKRVQGTSATQGESSLGRESWQRLDSDQPTAR